MFPKIALKVLRSKVLSVLYGASGRTIVALICWQNGKCILYCTFRTEATRMCSACSMLNGFGKGWER